MILLTNLYLKHTDSTPLNFLYFYDELKDLR